VAALGGGDKYSPHEPRVGEACLGVCDFKHWGYL